MQVAANWVWVYLMVAVCIHDIPPSPTLPPVHHTVHIYILNTGKHTRKGCAYTNIDDASQDTGKSVRATVKAFECPCRIYCGYPHLPVQMRRGDGEIQGRV